MKENFTFVKCNVDIYSYGDYAYCYVPLTADTTIWGKDATEVEQGLNMYMEMRNAKYIQYITSRY